MSAVPDDVMALFHELRRAANADNDTPLWVRNACDRAADYLARPSVPPVPDAGVEAKVWSLPRVSKTLEEMLDVATACNDEDRSDDDEWSIDQRTTIDKWQASFRDALAVPPVPDGREETIREDERDRCFERFYDVSGTAGFGYVWKELGAILPAERQRHRAETEASR